MRYVLWVGVVFNALVALMLVFPTTFDSWATLPPIGSDFYRWMLTFFVMLFSATYAWIALEPTISRPIVALAAIGKTGAFIIALVCLLLGDIHIKSLLPSCACYSAIFISNPSLFQPETWLLPFTSSCGCISRQFRRQMPNHAIKLTSAKYLHSSFASGASAPYFGC